MKIFGTPCAAAGCRRKTRDATGRCHDHRAGRWTYANGTPLPSPGIVYSPPGVTSARSSTDRWGETDLYYGEEWVTPDGVLHREDGPAETEFHSDARKPKTEKWLLDGEYTRIDGPAIVSYAEDGSVRSEGYAVRNHFTNDGPAGVVELLEQFGSEVIDEEISRSPLAPLRDEGVSNEEILAAIADGVRTPEGVREHRGGAPTEWIRAWESAG